jgi:hypothetical protein
MMRSPIASALVALSVPLAIFAAPNAAAGQEQNAVAVGGGFTFRAASSDEAHGDSGFGIRWRFGHSDTGWGWHYGLGWYAANLDRLVAGRRVSFGELKVRPIVAGYGYTRALTRRTAVTADIVGGIALSAFDASADGKTALREAGAPSTDIHTGLFTPVVKPEVGFWYDLGHRVGLGVNVGYTIARPRVTFSTRVGQESLRARADCLSVGLGIVYRIF